jgi:hypothetical protein
MKIYVAGPITGILNYREAFNAKEKELQEKGHIVINPAFLPDGLKDYMPICYAMIDQVDAVCFLNGWQNSAGSKLEYEYASKKGIQIIAPFIERFEQEEGIAL